MARRAIVMLLALGLSGLAVLAAPPDPAGAAEADRYEKYGGPPPRSAPPPPAPAPRVKVVQQPPRAGTYFFGSIGLFDPNDYVDGLATFDGGVALNVAVGSRVSPVLAVEGGVGYFEADGPLGDVSVVPVTIGGRLIIPHPSAELYFGGGLGFYSASYEGETPIGYPLFLIDDSDVTIGGYFSMGLDLWVNPRTALNLEGRYHWADPSFDGFDVDVSGWTLNVGVRVSF